MSHELRTPLALISATMHELRFGADLTDAERDTMWQISERNADRLRRLVNSLLAYGRLEAGHLETNLAATDVHALTTQTCASFAGEFERAGIRYVVDVDTIDQLLLVDAEMWETVVLNLLSNAYKFTLHGSVSVRLEHRPVDGLLVFTVTDTGAGIPPEQVGRVFDRFERVRGQAARTDEGAGIGLALVKAIVDRHSGSIAVTTSLGSGTTMMVTLPAVPAPSSTSDAAADLDASLPTPMVDRGSEKDTGLGRQRLMIVDDSEDVTTLLVVALSRRWHITTARNGEEALKQLSRVPVDLIITDAMMPVMDGRSLARCLRARRDTATVPVILLTGFGAATPEAVDGLIDQVIAKPFKIADLMSAIEILLAKSRTG